MISCAGMVDIVHVVITSQFSSDVLFMAFSTLELILFFSSVPNSDMHLSTCHQELMWVDYLKLLKTKLKFQERCSFVYTLIQSFNFLILYC